MSYGQPFNNGEQRYIGGSLPKRHDSELEAVRAWWPEFCGQSGIGIKLSDTEVQVPPLLHWERRGDQEIFRVDVRGVFAVIKAGLLIEMLPKFLKRARGAVLGHCAEVEPNVFEAVISHRRLPDDLPLCPSVIPKELHRFNLGELMDGSPGVIDWTVEFHGMAVGATGSGKTVACEPLILQALIKGWRVLVYTPKLADPLYVPYEGHERFHLITGESQEALTELVDALAAMKTERQQRQLIQSEHQCARWFDLPESMLSEWPPTLVLIDEGQSAFMSPAGKELQALASDFVRLGRSAGFHMIITSQMPLVDAFGGSITRAQLGFKLGVRRIPKDNLRQVYDDSTADLSLLTNPATPFGRAINRGLVAPDTLFGADMVADSPMQICRVTKEVREGLLSGEMAIGDEPISEPVEELESVEVIELFEGADVELLPVEPVSLPVWWIAVPCIWLASLVSVLAAVVAL